MTDETKYPPLTPDENGKITIDAQLLAFDVVNRNKRIYTKDCFKLPKHGYFSANMQDGRLTGEISEQFDISLREVVGWSNHVTANDEGLFANVTLSTKTPNGAMALRALEEGFVFAPRGTGTTSVDENGNTRIDSINIFGYNLVRDPAFNVKRTGPTTWEIDTQTPHIPFDEESKD